MNQKTLPVAPARVLAVDDHANAREWLRAAVAAAFPEAQIVEADSLAAARKALVSGPFGLLLIDLGLPDGSGLELLKEQRRSTEPGLCVITTVFDDDEHVFSALAAGAAGYVLKDQSQSELGELLGEMLEGRPPLSPAIARRMLSHFSAPKNAAGNASLIDEMEVALTARERDVLIMVAKGLSVRETAGALKISPHTAHGYVRDIYRKLSVSSRAEAALAANRMGLV